MFAFSSDNFVTKEKSLILFSSEFFNIISSLLFNISKFYDIISKKPQSTNRVTVCKKIRIRGRISCIPRVNKSWIFGTKKITSHINKELLL